MFYYGTYVAGALVIGKICWALNWSGTDLKKMQRQGCSAFSFCYLWWRSSLFLIAPPAKTRLSTAWPGYGMAKPRTQKAHG